MWSVGCIFAEFITKEPLLQGRGELDQLDKMFRLLGTPNEQIWPGLSELPGAKKLNFTQRPYNTLRAKMGTLITEACYDLLNKMLTYDPKKRITAAEALQHHYFQESPRAKEPEMMPTWPSSHDGRKRKHSPDDELLKEKLLGL
jgi:cell division cycle 2-like protein